MTSLMVGQARIEITKDQDLECLYWGSQRGQLFLEKKPWCKTQKTNQVLVDDLACFRALRNLMGDMFDEVSNMRLQELDLLLAPKFEIMLRAMQLLFVAFYFVGIIHQQDMSINRYISHSRKGHRGVCLTYLDQPESSTDSKGGGISLILEKSFWLLNGIFCPS